MKYNIVRNGNLSSITSDATLSGIGPANKTLTASELQTISNNITTYSGVPISASDSIMLKLDMAERIKVDGIRLYGDNVTSSGVPYFDVYWKDEEADNYSGASEGVSAGYYYATMSAPSAPQYIIITVSGLGIEIYEFVVYNDDYIVSFGTDGTQTEEAIEDSPIDSIGDAQAVEIYNQSSEVMPATAYVCINSTDAVADEYLEIGTSPNGTFYGLEDGVLIDDNQTANDYIWDMGSYDDTESAAPGNNVTPTAASAEAIAVNMGNIPLVSRPYSWYCGQNAWDYDSVNRIIYAIGANGELKLFKYPIDTGEWTYVGEIAPGCSGYYNQASMVYLDGYIYVLIDLVGNFGRYDLSGPTDNWESLSNIGWSVQPTRYGMCGDKNRYIYAIHHYYPNDANKEFRKYDTTTSGWGALSNGYNNDADNNSNYNRVACLAYDYDRDVIYADVGTNYGNSYLQRYTVSSGTWNIGWLNVDALTNATSDYNDHQSHSYFNGYLVLGHAQCGSRIYYYHIPTSTADYFTSSVGGFYSPGTNTAYYNPYILVTDHLTDELDNPNNPVNVAVWGSMMDTSRGVLYYLNSVVEATPSQYTTPIVSLEDKYMSSFIVVDSEGVISVDGSAVDSIEVRSSDTAPVPVYESYLITNDASVVRRTIWSPYDGAYNDLSTGWGQGGINDMYPLACSTDHKDGRYILHWAYGGNYYDHNYIRMYNRAGSNIYNWSSTTDYYGCYDAQLYFEGEHGLWGYSSYNNYNGRTLRHHDADISIMASYSESQTDFIYEIAPELHDGGRGVWYSNQIDETLVHMSTVCVKLQTIPLDKPRCVAPTIDGGVWVEEDTLNVVYRYDFDGTRISTFTIPEDASYGEADIDRMSGDLNNGFWYRHGDLIRHVTSNGIVDVGPIHITDASVLEGSPFGCFVHSPDDNIMYWIDMNGDITSKSMPSKEAAWFGIFCYGDNEFMRYKHAYLPTSYDPVWGDSGSSEWKIVPKSGYFLPKNKYHQFRFTLRSLDTSLNKIIMTPAIKVEDISAGSYKSLYIRTNIPSGADIANYESELKVWWDVEDN